MRATNLTIKLYRITASVDRAGQCLDASQAETLGEAYGVTYASKDAADCAVIDLQDGIEDTDLDSSTTYSTVEYPVQVTGIESTPEDEAITVSARITCADYTGETCWTAKPSHTAAGVGGLEPAGDSIDAWVDHDMARAVGDAVVAVGLEILAVAGQARA